MLVPVGAVAVVVAGVLLAAFQPWKLVVDQVVEEALPSVSTPAAPPSSAPSAGQPSPTAAAAPELVARGTFISHEHATSGSVRVLTLADGSRVLRIEGLDTSNGPDLRVWVSDQPVIDGRDGWFVFDDGEYVELGALKGNRGNQNYPVPAGIDLESLSSVTIWCARFSVSFGAAELVSA